MLVDKERDMRQKAPKRAKPSAGVQTATTLIGGMQGEQRIEDKLGSLNQHEVVTSQTQPVENQKSQRVKGSEGQFKHVGHNCWNMRNSRSMKEDLRHVGGPDGSMLWPGGFQKYFCTGLLKCSQLNKAVRGPRYERATYQTRYALMMQRGEPDASTCFDLDEDNIVADDDHPEAFEWGANDTKLANHAAIAAFNLRYSTKTVQANIWDLFEEVGRMNGRDLRDVSKFSLRKGLTKQITAAYEELVVESSEKPRSISHDFGEFSARCANESSHEFAALEEIRQGTSSELTEAVHAAAVVIAQLRQRVYAARNRYEEVCLYM